MLLIWFFFPWPGALMCASYAKARSEMTDQFCSQIQSGRWINSAQWVLAFRSNSWKIPFSTSLTRISWKTGRFSFRAIGCAGVPGQAPALPSVEHGAQPAWESSGDKPGPWVFLCILVSRSEERLWKNPTFCFYNSLLVNHLILTWYYIQKSKKHYSNLA